MGSLLKLDAIEQPLNITCYGVGCHNKRGIKGVDVFARNRTFGMSNQRCNSDLREPQIVRKACEAVSQDMRGNTIKGRTLENPVPLMRERAKDWAVSQAGEDIIPVGIGIDRKSTRLNSSH